MSWSPVVFTVTTANSILAESFSARRVFSIRSLVAESITAALSTTYRKGSGLGNGEVVCADAADRFAPARREAAMNATASVPRSRASLMVIGSSDVNSERGSLENVPFEALLHWRRDLGRRW